MTLLAEPAFNLASDFAILRDTDYDDRVQFAIAAPVNGRITITIPDEDGGSFVVADASGNVDLGAGDFTTTGRGTFGDVQTANVFKAGGVSIGDGSFIVEICSNGSQPSIHAVDYDLLITADGGDISFGNENLATTGDVSCANLTCSADIDCDYITCDDITCDEFDADDCTADSLHITDGLGGGYTGLVMNNYKKIIFYDSTTPTANVGMEMFVYTNDECYIDAQTGPLHFRTAAGGNCRMEIDYTNGIYMGDGGTHPCSWTNYVQITPAGVMTFHGSAALIVPSGTSPTPNTEGALFLDTDAGANGTLVMYSNGAWRTVQAF